MASDFPASHLVSSTRIHTYIHTYLPLGETHEVNEYYVWRAFCALIGHVDSLGLPVSWVVVHRTYWPRPPLLLAAGRERSQDQPWNCIQVAQTVSFLHAFQPLQVSQALHVSASTPFGNSV